MHISEGEFYRLALLKRFSVDLGLNTSAKRSDARARLYIVQRTKLRGISSANRPACRHLCTAPSFPEVIVQPLAEPLFCSMVRLALPIPATRIGPQRENVQ
jgi:hypothetical protein